MKKSRTAVNEANNDFVCHRYEVDNIRNFLSEYHGKCRKAIVKSYIQSMKELADSTLQYYEILKSHHGEE